MQFGVISGLYVCVLESGHYGINVFCEVWALGINVQINYTGFFLKYTFSKFIRNMPLILLGFAPFLLGLSLIILGFAPFSPILSAPSETGEINTF